MALVPDRAGLRASVAASSGVAVGVLGSSDDSDDGSSGLVGQATSATGDVLGVLGQTASADGSAGVFDNLAGGDVLRGLADGVEVFSVDGAGQIGANALQLVNDLCFSSDCRSGWTWDQDIGGDLTYAGGKVGIGTPPTEELTVLGNISASGAVCDSVGCIGATDWADITNKPTSFPPAATRSGNFRVFGKLDVDDNTYLAGDLRVGVNEPSDPTVSIGGSGLLTLEAFYQESGRFRIKAFNGGVARIGLELEADAEGQITLFDGQPTQVPNTINQTVFLDGKSGSRGGKILIRDGLQSDPVIELIGYDPTTPVDVASIRLKGALIVESDGGAGGYIEAGQVLLSSYLQLALTSGAPSSGDCNSSIERGRAKFDPTTGTLWICAVSGWTSK